LPAKPIDEAYILEQFDKAKISKSDPKGKIVEIYFHNTKIKKSGYLPIQHNRIVGRLTSYQKASQGYRIDFSTLVFLKQQISPETILRKAEAGTLAAYENETVRNCYYAGVDLKNIRKIKIRE
jgi:hypothetical protein